MEKHAEKKESPAKAYLNRIRFLEEMINEKIADRDATREMLYRITPVLKDDAVSFSGNQDKIGTGAAKLADYEAELDEMIDRLVDMKREIISQLEKLKDIDHYKVLKLRYVHCYTFERIATEMNYSYRGICYLHGRALQAFEKVIEFQSTRPGRDETWYQLVTK